jgi:hypothetical protein
VSENWVFDKKLATSHARTAAFGSTTGENAATGLQPIPLSFGIAEPPEDNAASATRDGESHKTSGTLTLSGNTTITAADTGLYTAYTTTNGSYIFDLIANGGGKYDFSAATFTPNIHFSDSSGAADILGPKNGGWLEGSGKDTITGGAGNDTVYVATQDVSASLSLNGGLGENVLELANGVSISTFTTSPKSFQTLQLDGTATINAAESTLFTSIIDSNNSYVYNLYASGVGTYDFSKETFLSGVHFHGFASGDKILGPGNGAWLEGTGNDTVMGGAGNDLVYVVPTDAASGLVLNGGLGQNTLELADGTNLSILLSVPQNFENLQLDGSATVSSAQSSAFENVTDGNNSYVYNLFASGTGTYDFSKENFLSGVHFHGLTGGDDILGAQNGAWLEGSGDDTVLGGAGNDLIYVSQADVAPGLVLNGGLGQNLLELAGGTNLSTLTAVPANFESLQLDGSATISGAQSTAFADVTDQNNSYVFDLFASGSGTFDFSHETFASGVHFHGLVGTDKILGAQNGAWLEGSGNDTVMGGAGNDLFYLAPADEAPGLMLDGGLGQNTLELANGANLSILQNTPKNFETLQLDGNATITAAKSTAFANVTDANNSYVYNLDASGTGTYDFSKETFASGVHFHGFAGGDKILGAMNGAWLEGSGGDTVVGGAGNDIVYVAPTDASPKLALNGGLGQNLLELANGTNISTLTTAPVDFQTLQLDGGATISAGQSGLFATIQDANNSYVYDLVGSGTGTYNFSKSTVQSGVHFIAGAGTETVIAAGSNYIGGGSGSDTLIAANVGNATLAGGTGTDLFVLDKFAASGDQITGFTGAGVAGGDTLDLHGFGTGASLVYDGSNLYTVNYASGSETFTIQTTDGNPLTAGDYTFK